MTGPITPTAIASVVRSHSISLQEAADLIQHYAEEYAALEVEKHMRLQRQWRDVLIEMPLVGIAGRCS